MQLIDGKMVAKGIKERVKADALAMAQNGHQPSLAVVLVGDDKASQTYVNSKEKACATCEIKSVMHRLPAATTQAELLSLISRLNSDESIDGILVQLPLPKHIDTNAIIEAIDPAKDVDGFCAVNVGRLRIGLGALAPCTPLGIMRLFEHYGIDVLGKHIVIINHSNIVGKPMDSLALLANATVTVTHIHTRDLPSHTRMADIVITAVGIPNFLRAEMIKEGAIVIDVGISRLDDGRITGDVAFDEVAPKCSYITPVPGGVGPMTIAMLMSNTIEACKARHK